MWDWIKEAVVKHSSTFYFDSCSTMWENIYDIGIQKVFLPWRVISHDLIIEVPEDVGRWLWCMGDDTGQVNCGTSVDMQIWWSLYSHMRNWIINIWHDDIRYNLNIINITNYVQSYWIRLRGLCWYLTFIYTSISLLRQR